jgi:hypothetical protein
MPKPFPQRAPWPNLGLLGLRVATGRLTLAGRGWPKLVGFVGKASSFHPLAVKAKKERANRRSQNKGQD